MLQLRFSRFCSLQPFPILQGRRYKWNKVVGFRTLHTVKMDLTKTQAIQQNQQPLLYQNVIVMRHGERMDNFDPLWSSTAARPWDPPLAPPGLIQAFETGRTIQKDIGFPIHRIVVSPFLRCIQTAAELVAGLFAVDDSHDTFYVSIDPSKVKVSIEYGVCEMMNSIAIRLNVFPKDGIFSFDIAEREAMLPPGTVDNDVEMVYKELPKWEEPKLEARARYQQTIKDLADKYPTQNLLFVTHAEGVQVARSSIKMDVVYKKVEYCGYVELRRPIYEKDHSFTCGEFDTLTQSAETGVSNISSQGLLAKISIR